MSSQQALQAALERHRDGDFVAAESIYRQILRSNPEQPDALHLLGLLAFQTNRLCDSIELFRRALAVKPTFAHAWHSLGKALHLQGRTDEAAFSYRKAIESSHDHVDAYCDYATLLAQRGQIDEAIAVCRQALGHKPDFALAHYNLSLLLLLKGDYAQGFRQYEWRWQAGELGLIQRNFAQPQWKGEELHGRCILLHCEQGFGDAIQFIRYAPLIAERGGEVIVECHGALKRLFSGISGIKEIVVEDSPLPEFHVHCPLHSLPLAMGTTVETIPSSVPYLHEDDRLCHQWEKRLKSDPAALKVGIVWAGMELQDGNHNRSIDLRDLAPLTLVAGVSCYSLQKGQSALQSDPANRDVALIDFTNKLNDFADTAGLIANLDLIISIDTSVAHLAGAMGKPAWVLLPLVADWRWMLDRRDSPWYPTMRLFRQNQHNDWESPVHEVLDALRQTVNATQKIDGDTKV